MQLTIIKNKMEYKNRIGRLEGIPAFLINTGKINITVKERN